MAHRKNQAGAKTALIIDSAEDCSMMTTIPIGCVRFRTLYFCRDFSQWAQRFIDCGYRLENSVSL